MTKDGSWLLGASQGSKGAKPPPLCHEKSQGRTMSVANREHEVWVIHPLHQKSSISIALG